MAPPGSGGARPKGTGGYDPWELDRNRLLRPPEAVNRLLDDGAMGSGDGGSRHRQQGPQENQDSKQTLHSTSPPFSRTCRRKADRRLQSFGQRAWVTHWSATPTMP